MNPPTGASAGQDTVASLKARLARSEREAAARQRQLEAYASDLREVFKEERTRAQELRRSYRAAVGWATARERLNEAAGTHFDPAMVAAYETVPDEAFARIREGIA